MVGKIDRRLPRSPAEILSRVPDEVVLPARRPPDGKRHVCGVLHPIGEEIMRQRAVPDDRIIRPGTGAGNGAPARRDVNRDGGERVGRRGAISIAGVLQVEDRIVAHPLTCGRAARRPCGRKERAVRRTDADIYFARSAR